MLRWYAEEGLDGLRDRSHRPQGHPAQTPAEVESAICELRRTHPRWGQRRLHYELGRRGCPGPVPSLTTIYRVLIRHGLIDPVPRRRRRQDYRRWQRERPMELWQMDIVGGVMLANGREAKVVTGVHQTLQRELLDTVPAWPDIETVQAAIDAFRHEYNTDRPHQSLDMAFPADRFTARPTDSQLPLRLPPTLTSDEARPDEPSPVTVPKPRPPLDHRPATAPRLLVSANGVDPVNLAVEITRVVPASGNLAVCGQQFWLGPARAGLTIGLWVDTTVVHLLLDGVRLKTVPSRLAPGHLRQLLADGGRPAGPPPVTAGPVKPGAPIEVDRLVNATGLVSLAGRQYPIGYHLAGRRITIRLDRGVLHILDADRSLLRSLPNPLTPTEQARVRDARPAGPPPPPSTEPLRIERRVSSRGVLVIAGQRIHVGIGHAGRTVTVEDAGDTFRIHDRDQVLTEVPRTSTKNIARFKARKPEPPRRRLPLGSPP